MMEYAALGFLMYRPLSMYDLKKAMERSTQHFLSASFGTLHPLLQKIERQGFVTSEAQVGSGRTKKVYTITAAGRAHFVEWLGHDVMAERVSDPRLLRLFFLGHLAAAEREELLARFLAQMETGAEELERLKAQVQQVAVPPGWEDHMAYQLATLEFGIAHHRFVRDWYQAKLQAIAGSDDAR
ncbi:Transcriptional regulator PadR-like family protein [compost metagenome]